MPENKRRTPPPAPASIGEEARQYLDMTSEYPEASTAPTHESDPQEWLDWAATLDGLMVEVFGARLPADLPFDRSEFELDGVRTYVLTPKGLDDQASAPLYIDIHGGGLVTGSGEACLTMTTASAIGRDDMITWAPDYRIPPLHPYPAAIDDLIAVYAKALEERDPRDIIVSGGSAGGNLAAAMMLRARDEGLPMPAALVLSTPQADLTESGDSFQTNLGVDRVLSSLMEANLLYAAGHDLTDPYLSPVYGDFSGFPPTYLQSGTRDLFLSNTVRVHRRLRAAGVEAELHIGEAMPHGGFGGSTPEDLELKEELARFVRRHRRDL